jgi:hypothetical protein
MKRAVVAVVLSLFVATVAGSVWAEDVAGTIKVIQVKERVMTLDDGTQLHWTEAVSVAPEIKPGAKVKATYETAQDGKLVLKKVEVVK